MFGLSYRLVCELHLSGLKTEYKLTSNVFKEFAVSMVSMVLLRLVAGRSHEAKSVRGPAVRGYARTLNIRL